MRTSLLLLVAAAVICAVATPAAALFRGWKPIKHVDQPHIQGLGKWAVAEHVKGAQDGLKFSEVVSGRLKIDAGVRYELVIGAMDAKGKKGTYSAEVQEGTSPTVGRKLVSFSAKSSADQATAGRKD